MKLPQLLQKPLQVVALSAGTLLSSAVPNEAQAQQSWPRNNLGNHQFHNRNEIFGGGFPSGPGPYGAAGTNVAQGYWAPIYNQQIQNPSRNNFSPYQNNFNNPNGSNLNSNFNRHNVDRSQGQTLSRSQLQVNNNYNYQQQVDPRLIEKQKRHEAILEQIRHAKTSPDGTFKYVLNINNSKFHLIIPISKDFELPEMKEMYRVKFEDPLKAGTQYYYMVTNDSVETSYKQQKSPMAPTASTAGHQTISCIREVICCPCK